MEGWRLYHDPFYKPKEEQMSSDEVIGNPNRYSIFLMLLWSLEYYFKTL